MQELFKVLPTAIAAEISALAALDAHFYESLGEIRLRCPGVCGLVLSGSNLILKSRIREDDLQKTVEKLCHGSLYAYRHAMEEGYLPFSGGIRVGIAGTARYDRDKLFGISEITGLSFRIPHDRADTLDALLSAFREAKRGMLIYSPPGIGKTTALRAMAKALGSGENPRRVAVIDERFEFPCAGFAGTSVDVLAGFSRGKGLEIAIRTLSPEVVVLDEIGNEKDASSLLYLSRCGIPSICSVHAQSIEDIQKKVSLSPFLSAEIFDVFAGIERKNGRYSVSIERECR